MAATTGTKTEFTADPIAEKTARNAFSGSIHGQPTKRISATYHWPADVPVAKITSHADGYTITNIMTGRESEHKKQSEVFAVLKHLYDTR